MNRSFIYIIYQIMENPSFYAILYSNIRYASNITDLQKLLCAEITALMWKQGYCYANNAYFAKVFNKTKNHISDLLSDLNKKWYIKIEIEKNFIRKITINIEKSTQIIENNEFISKITIKSI